MTSTVETEVNGNETTSTETTAEAVVEATSTIDSEDVAKVTETAAEEVSAIEETANEHEGEVDEEVRILFGMDVSNLGTEYPATRHRSVNDFRKEITKLEQAMYKMTDDSLEILAKNIAVALNRLEARSKNRRCHNGA